MNIPINGFEDWLINKNLKARTVKEYLYYFGKFVPYAAFTQESVNRFLSEKSNRNPSARCFIVNLKKFLMVNYKELGIDKNRRIEIAEVELAKLSGRLKERLVKPLTEDQILEIEKHLPDEKEKLQLLMTYYAGLRAGELLKIQVSSFGWDEWKKDMTQYGECRVLGKGDKEGLAFFPPLVMTRIARFVRAKNFPSLSSYLFLKNKEDLEGVKIEGRLVTWERKLKQAAIKAGIVQFDSNKKIIEDTNVHPHKLRHSYGYYLRNVKKLDIREVQEILRHSSILSTQRYTHTDKAHVKKILKEMAG